MSAQDDFVDIGLTEEELQLFPEVLLELPVEQVKETFRELEKEFPSCPPTPTPSPVDFSDLEFPDIPWIDNLYPTFPYIESLQLEDISDTELSIQPEQTTERQFASQSKALIFDSNPTEQVGTGISLGRTPWSEGKERSTWSAEQVDKGNTLSTTPSGNKPPLTVSQTERYWVPASQFGGTVQISGVEEISSPAEQVGEELVKSILVEPSGFPKFKRKRKRNRGRKRPALGSIQENQRELEPTKRKRLNTRHFLREREQTLPVGCYRCQSPPLPVNTGIEVTPCTSLPTVLFPQSIPVEAIAQAVGGKPGTSAFEEIVQNL